MDIRAMQQEAADAKRPPPKAVDADGNPVFAWYEIAADRDRLRQKVRSARWWLINADPETAHKYAHGINTAVSLLDEAIEILDRDVDAT